MNKIFHGDCLEVLKTLPENSIDSIVTDPPYELGFMGKSWDSTGIANNVEMWKECLRVLKPGGHLLSFGGTRTYHRMASAIEDAGFEVRDMIEWVYGSGFPKSLNIGKSVEAFVTTGNASKNGFHKLDGERRDGRIGMYDTVEEQGFRVKNPDQLGAYDLDPTTDEAKQWNGYGTALKPAHEPICMARKPLDSSSICENCEGRGDVNIGAKECWVCNGTGKIKSKKLSVAENVLKYGTGGLNIDGCRVSNPNEDTGRNNKRDVADTNTVGDWGMKAIDTTGRVGLGRFPANLIHDGSDEVVALFPQTGKARPDYRNNEVNASHVTFSNRRQPNLISDNGGSASRYFYCSKASKSERNAGLEGFETKVNGAFDGNVDTKNARKIGANPERQNIPTANGHPTVKPLSLTKYLATLIKPPTGGRLLVPFSGSGSEMIGALQAGWEYVEGVELTEEYIPIAEARIKYWQNISQTSSKPKASARKISSVQKEPT